MGHVKRSLLIANKLCENKNIKKKNIIFVARKNSNFKHGYNQIKFQGYLVIKCNDKHLKPNSKEELHQLTKLNPSLIIFDRHATTKKIINNIKEKKINVVSFDDIGSGSKFTDKTINAILKSKHKSSNILNGYKYLFLDDLKKNKYKSKSKNVTKLFISFGGYDKRKLIKFFLDAVSLDQNLIDLNLNYRVYTNILQREYKCELLKKIHKIKKKKINVKLISNSKNFYKNLAISDVAIVNGGLTVFDAIKFKIPTIAIPQYVHQLNTLTKLNKMGIVLVGSKKMSLSKAKLVKNLLILIEDANKRKSLERNMTKFLKLSSTGTVLNEIIKLI